MPVHWLLSPRTNKTKQTLKLEDATIVNSDKNCVADFGASNCILFRYQVSKYN